MKSYKLKFLEKAVLGQKTDFEKSDKVLEACIKLAYRDMLTAGRFYLTNTTDEGCSTFKRFLENHNYQFSRGLIEETMTIFGQDEKIGNGNKYATRYGLTQKLVNMSYKYFYVFSDYIDKNIDFSACDCPLDSIILRKLKVTKSVWSKMTREEYEKAQEKIAEEIKQTSVDAELKQVGNLAYDFINW